MNGQKKSYDKTQRLVDEYIEKYNPFSNKEPVGIDLRAYSNYLKEHNIKDIEEQRKVAEMFKI